MLNRVSAALRAACAVLFIACSGPILRGGTGGVQFVFTNATQGPQAQEAVYVTVTGLDAAGTFQRVDAGGHCHPCLPSDNTITLNGATWCAYSFPLPPSFTLDAGQNLASGRLYLSLGAPLFLRVDPATGGLVQPDPVDQQGNGHVFGHGQGGDQIEGLEHEADIPASVVHDLVSGETAEILAEQAALPGSLVQDPGHDGDESRLSASGRTDQHEQLAGLNLQVDPPEGLNLGIAGSISLSDAQALDGRSGRHS